jgi:integrase
MNQFKLEMIEGYGPTRVNGSITVIREMLDVAIEKNMTTKADRNTLLEDLKYMPVDYDYKRLLAHLPEHPILVKLRAEVHRRCKNRGELGHWLFDFLLFSGCRIESANEAMWEDVDWRREELYFREAKYGPYTIPLFPDLKECLEGLKTVTGGKPGTKILPTKSLQTVLTSSCVAIGTPHLSHHDLRHIFATQAIEAGKDILLVAGWLGHKDNGRTVLLIYGHLRKGHSHAEAKTMRFVDEKDKQAITDFAI